MPLLPADRLYRSPEFLLFSGASPADRGRGDDDRLVDGLRWPLRIFHSRYNDVAESDLVARGYRILSRTENSGVDIFTRRCGSLFVFFQGHPEYDGLALFREYRRDVGRFLRRQRETYPAMPRGYFDEDAKVELIGTAVLP